METLEQYINKVHPNIVDEYKRVTVPFYYEPEAIYHPITNGFGCGPEGSNERFIIVNGTYMKNGDIQMSLQSLDTPNHRCGVTLSEAHLKIARVNKDETPKGLSIPNNKQIKYMTVNERP